MLLPKPPENVAVAVGVSRSSALLRKACRIWEQNSAGRECDSMLKLRGAPRSTQELGAQGEGFLHQGAHRKQARAVGEETGSECVLPAAQQKRDLMRSWEQTGFAKETGLHCQFVFPAGITSKTPNEFG